MLSESGTEREQLVASVDAALERGMRVRPTVGGFPHFAEALRCAGVERFDFVVPSTTTVYVTARGDVLKQGPPLVAGAAVVERFDRDALIAALRADQEGRSTFPEFAAAAWRAGVVSWTVDLVRRTCVYRPASGNGSYVESYPAVEIA